MAAPGRSVDFDLERRVLGDLLEREPYRFRFFQSVRLLERMDPQRAAVGDFVKPSTEVVRFRTEASTDFPASEVHAIEWPHDKAPRMFVNFMGLIGPQSVLPTVYTELVIERDRAKDRSLHEFFDIFNHRAISLFYLAWQKYRFTVRYERGEKDLLTDRLMEFTGLGTGGLQGRQEVSDDGLLYYTGLLAQQPRSAAALRQILEDYFDVPVEIEQFAGTWYPLEKKSQTRLDEGASPAETLGFGTVLGDEIYDQQCGVRIRLGPLSVEQYQDFLPGGEGYKQLASIVKFYGNDQIDFELQLVLKREEAPACELGKEDEAAPRLGWVTWAKTRDMDRDPGETVLRL